MKYILLFLIVPTLSWSASFSCILNKSYSLELSTAKKGTGITLQLKHFLDPMPEELTEFEHAQVIQYGPTLIVLEDRGRSGYALIRIQEKHNEDGESFFEGVLDINLFGPEFSPINTNGQLRTTFCYKI